MITARCYSHGMVIKVGDRVRHSDGYPVTGTVVEIRGNRALVNWDGERDAPCWYKVHNLRTAK